MKAANRRQNRRLLTQALTKKTGPGRRAPFHTGLAIRTGFFLLVILLVVIALTRADAGIDEHGQELSAFDKLGVIAHLVSLDVEQEPTVAEDVARVNDSGRLFVLGNERGVVEDGRIEEFRVVLGDLNELTRGDLVKPNLGDAGIVTGIFVHDNASEWIDGHIVEHLVTLAARQ